MVGILNSLRELLDISEIRLCQYRVRHVGCK